VGKGRGDEVITHPVSATADPPLQRRGIKATTTSPLRRTGLQDLYTGFPLRACGNDKGGKDSYHIVHRAILGKELTPF